MLFIGAKVKTNSFCCHRVMSWSSEFRAGECLTEILLQMFVNGLTPETISQPSPAAAGQNGSANVSFIEFHPVLSSTQ